MKNSLKITNLPMNFAPASLEELFAMIGIVRSVRIENEKSGAALSRGFVEMATAEEAQDCIDYFNDQTRRGLQLQVTREQAASAKLPSAKRPDFFKKELRTLARKVPTGSFA